MGHAVLVVDDGEGLAPVALAGEEPVAQLVLNLAATGAVLFQPFDGLGDGLRLIQAIEVQTIIVGGVYQRAVLGPGFFLDIAAGDDLRNWQAKGLGKLIVARIVRGYRHDGAGTVTGQHVVCDEDRDALAGDRVGGIGAQEYAGLFLVFLALQVRLRCDIRAVGLDGFLRVIVAVGPALIHVIVVRNGGQEGIDKLMLRCQDHVFRAKERIWARGKHVDAVAFRREGYLRTAGATDPVALHGLDLLRPIQQLQIIEQAIRIRGNAHHPLGQIFAEYREVAALRLAFRGDLLVGQDGTQAWAPVHRGVGQVHQAELIDGLGLLLRGQVLVVAPVLGGALIGLQFLDELSNGAGLLLLFIEPGIINLQEDPLGPLKEFWIRGFHRAARIVAQAQHAQLAAHVVDIGHRGGPRVRTGLDGVLFGRQAEGIVAHGVQHVLAQHAVIAGVSISGDITKRVPHVQARTGRVGEHVLHVELFLGQLARTRG